jgi:alpha-beta hydrolase superfamily lysophospholipase
MNTEKSEFFLKMTDGFDLFCRTWIADSETAKTVMCIHGFGGHSGSFEPLGRRLSADGANVYGIDLRGFGNSKEKDLPRGDIKDFRRHLQDIDEAVNLIKNHSKCQKLYLLGHSLGGLYALWYGAKYPGVANGFVIAAPAIDVKPRIPPEIREKLTYLYANTPETMIDIRRVTFPSSLAVQDELRTFSVSVRYSMGIGMTLMREKIFQNAANVRDPTLIVQGEADSEAAPNGALKLFNELGTEDKTLRMLPGVDHFLWGSAETVCSTILDWLFIH